MNEISDQSKTAQNLIYLSYFHQFCIDGGLISRVLLAVHRQADRYRLIGLRIYCKMSAELSLAKNIRKKGLTRFYAGSGVLKAIAGFDVFPQKSYTD